MEIPQRAVVPRRYANVHQYEGDKPTINDFRMIVNYDIPLL